MKKQLPDYFLKALYTHYKRIAEHATCSPADTRTTNALRLARADISKLEKYLSNERTKTTSGET